MGWIRQPSQAVAGTLVTGSSTRAQAPPRGIALDRGFASSSLWSYALPGQYQQARAPVGIVWRLDT